MKGSVIAEYIFEIAPLLYPFSIEFRYIVEGNTFLTWLGEKRGGFFQELKKVSQNVSLNFATLFVLSEPP